MLGVIVNTLAVIAGSAIGLLFKRAIPEKISKAILLAIGLCLLYIGVDGALEGSHTLVLILSMVLGTAVGTAIDLDRQLNRLGDWVNGKFSHTKGSVNVTEGFVTGSLFFCIGAMAVVGSLNSGLRGDHTMLYTKSVLDFFTACMMSVSLGFGVMFGAATVFVYQGAIVLLAHLIAPLLSTEAIAELTCAGSVMILALGLNMIGIAKIKVANLLPGLIFVPVLLWLTSYLPI